MGVSRAGEVVGMRTETVRRTAAALAAAALGVAGFAIGRLSSPGLRYLAPSPSSTSAQYMAGFEAGAALGRQEGRALQVGVSLPTTQAARVRAAFDAGYTAGANDVFNGYDGGWAMSTPYLVTLAAGSGRITYRIGSRTPLSPHTAYFLCPDGHDVCREPRR